ncbi:hypothetical protein HDU89_008216 [Geranomyces variabilis]|nr:hypothetical protein HDU89_008216 [Geranomyces variabilis]
MHRSWMERGSFEPRDLHPSFNRQDLKPYVEHLNEKSGKRVSPLCVYGGPVLLVFIVGMLVVFLGDDLFKSCKQVEDSSFDTLYPDVFSPPRAATRTPTPFAEVFTANGRPTTVWVTATATTRAGSAPGAAAAQTAVGAAAPALAPAAAAATGAPAPVTPATSANPASPANAQPANAQPANAQPANAQPADAQPVNPPAPSPDAVNPVPPKPVPPKPTPPVAPPPVADPPPSTDKSTAPPDTGNWVTGHDNARGLPDTSRCPTDVWSPDYDPCLAATRWEWAERHGLHFNHPRRLRRAASQPQLPDEITTVTAATAANAKTYHEECENRPLPRVIIAFVFMLVTAGIAALVERSDMSDARDAAQKAVDDLNKRSAGSQLRWSYGEDKKTIITTHVHNGFAHTSKQTRKYPVVQLYAMTPPPQVVIVQQQRNEGLRTEEERLNAGIARLASVASSAGITRLSSIGEPSRVASVGSSSSYAPASSVAAASCAPSSSVAASYAPPSSSTAASYAPSSSGSSATLVAPPAPVASPAPYAPPEAYYQGVLKVRPTAVPQPSWATPSESATPQPAPLDRPAPITESDPVAQPASTTRPLSEHDMAPPYSEVWQKEDS